MSPAQICACAALAVLASSVGAQSAVPGEEWGYVTVREGAHMFWWLYGANGTIDPEKPLVMWLQGGPGGSSTGFGNFVEIGPLNVSLQPRPFPWTNEANVLFVDNPVGVGYSYVEETKDLTTNVEQIATDLVTLFKGFMTKMPQFKSTPFYIFCESYGGKMTAAFGVALKAAISAGSVTSDFRGVALGDSWISPIDSVRAWVSYLYTLSQIDNVQVAALEDIVKEIELAMSHGNFTMATHLWDKMEGRIEEFADGVDFYNVLLHNTPGEVGKELFTRMNASFSHPSIGRLFARHVAPLHAESLSELMNGPIRKKLEIIPDHVRWGGQAGLVFTYQEGDFMKDVIADVTKLLELKVGVTIYQGQLDLIVPTIGTEAWLSTVPWSGMERFKEAKRTPVYPPSGRATRNTGAFVKKSENLAFYWIMKAGHMVPRDQGETAQEMLRQVLHHESTL